MGGKVRPRKEWRTAPFFDFDDPEGGLNEFVATTQFRVRRGNERDGPEDDERLFTPLSCCSQWRPAGGDGGRGAAFLNSRILYYFAQTWRAIGTAITAIAVIIEAAAATLAEVIANRCRCFSRRALPLGSNPPGLANNAAPVLDAKVVTFAASNIFFQVPQLISQSANLVVAIPLAH